jgi:hypothetical protein
MPAKILETQQIEKEVVFLTNPEPHFVSLVNRGANQEPWIVVKEQKEDNMAVRKVLQAIVVPNGTDEDLIRSVIGDEINLQVSKTQGEFTSYELVPREACKADSFELVFLSEENETIKGLAAEIIAEKSEGFFKKLFKPEKKQIFELDMDTIKRDFSEEQKKELADSGKALPDGSFPIVNGKDLDEAIKSVGRSSDPATAKKHIIKQAKELGMIDKLPDNWEVHKVEFLEAIEMEVEKIGKKISADRLGKLKTMLGSLASIIDEVEDQLDTNDSEENDVMKCSKCGATDVTKEGVCAKCGGKMVEKAEQFSPEAISANTGPNFAAVTCWKCGGTEKEEGFCYKCGTPLRKLEEKGEEVKKEEIQNLIGDSLKPISEQMTTLAESIKSMTETVAKMQKQPATVIKDERSDGPAKYTPTYKKQNGDLMTDKEKEDDAIFANLIFDREKFEKSLED